MKRTNWILILIVALLVVSLPLTAMAAQGEAANPEDGDISVEIGPGTNVGPQVYTVVFKSWDGTVLSTTEYEYGAALVFPTAPARAEDEYGTYTFECFGDAATGAAAPAQCIGNATYTALYNITYKQYTVKFLMDDGSVIETLTLTYGAEVTAPTPTKLEDAEYTYTFTGWDKEVVAVAGDATYTAVFTAEKKETEPVKNGWVQENGGWYYYQNGTMVKDKWEKDSKGWCYLGSDGKMLTNQWKKDSKGWCYIDGSGYIVYNKWVKDSKGWCYVDASGYMVYNKWVKDSKGWCFVDGSGYMVYNKWVKDSKGWCYVDGSGYMVYNKWIKDSTGWCYVDASGYMVYNKWVKDGGSWYYVDSTGYMVAGRSMKIGGKTYNFNASGVCTNP